MRGGLGGSTFEDPSQLPNDLLLASSMISNLASNSDLEDTVVAFVEDVTASVADYAENIQRSTKDERFLVYKVEQISWDDLLLEMDRQQQEHDVLVVNSGLDSA